MGNMAWQQRIAGEKGLMPHIQSSNAGKRQSHLHAQVAIITNAIITITVVIVVQVSDHLQVEGPPN